MGTLSTLSKERLLRVQIASDHECENTENKKTLQDFRVMAFTANGFNGNVSRLTFTTTNG